MFRFAGALNGGTKADEGGQPSAIGVRKIEASTE
jgi:hypothetical protein